MPQWGRNDQAVTANSTTTKESTNGAPIGVYALVKGAKTSANAIYLTAANARFGNTSPGSMASIDSTLFNNTSPSVFISKQVVGVFGVSATEQTNNTTNSSKEHPAHAGWNLRRAGTGPLISITSNNAGLTGYNNNDIITFKSPVAGGNATASFVTNSTGGALSFTITNPGYGFVVTTVPASNVFVTNATGGTAAGNSTTTYIIGSIGGRAGRVHYETLVAMGSLGAQSAAFGTPVTANDASTDNTQFPGI